MECIRRLKVLLRLDTILIRLPHEIRLFRVPPVDVGETEAPMSSEYVSQPRRCRALKQPFAKPLDVPAEENDKNETSLTHILIL